MTIDMTTLFIVGTIILVFGIGIGYAICAFCASSKMSNLYEIIQDQRKELQKQRNRIIDFAIDCAPKFRDIEQADPDPYTPEEQEKALANIRQLFDQVAEEERKND
jgi:uncharacterized membrane-anchored protein YhcB (DUF1043 family)